MSRTILKILYSGRRQKATEISLRPYTAHNSPPPDFRQRPGGTSLQAFSVGSMATLRSIDVPGPSSATQPTFSPFNRFPRADDDVE